MQNRSDPKNSAVIEFPSGKVLERVPINPRQEMEAPTRGNYVILKPVKDALVGVLDLTSQNFVIGSTKSSAMDAFDQDVLTQRASGEVGIFDRDAPPKGSAGASQKRLRHAAGLGRFS